ncbi:MAG: vitamin K epoxide reductase family protein [Deltaproteobacteria bacterium]|nr:vitamin K epoxide reductase family protein [Deltaproteobacteria bacterium]
MRRWTVPLAALGAVGLALAIYLTWLHVRLHTDPGYVSACALGGALNCETVAASKYSTLLGAPISVWGILGYLGLLALLRVESGRGDKAGAAGLLALYGILLAAASVALAAVSFLAIRAMCLVCAATYAVNLGVLAVALANARARGGLRARLGAEWKEIARRPRAAVGWGVAGLLLAAAVSSGMPRYWELASWRRGAPLDNGIDEQGLPWLGARAPRVTVHEYVDYECVHCRVAHRKLRRMLAEHPDELRIVRHDFARMTCSLGQDTPPGESCLLVRGGICAADKGRFWDWNDAVMAVPRPLKGEARKTYALDMAVKLGFDRASFSSCLASRSTVDRAQLIYKEAMSRKVRETPSYVVDGRIVPPAELHDELESRL